MDETLLTSIEDLHHEVIRLRQKIVEQQELIERYRRAAKGPTFDVPLAGSVMGVGPENRSTSVKRKPNEKETLQVKQARLTEIIEQARIKYPTEHDEAEFPEADFARQVWQAIITLFVIQPGGIVTDRMIADRMRMHNPAHWKSMQRYFNHNFAMRPNERWMSVRQYVDATGSEGWLVLMPTWLHDEIVSGGHQSLSSSNEENSR